MFEEKNFVPENSYNFLFMKDEDLIKIKELGHCIGLHSHSHPTVIEKLSFKEQLNEYNVNIQILSQILKCKKDEIKFMSHPCGSYNKDTLNILNDLGIELGFKQIMTVEKEKNMKKINNSNLEIAREDQSEIIKMMS